MSDNSVVTLNKFFCGSTYLSKSSSMTPQGQEVVKVVITNCKGNEREVE
ncbi:hypothetical protein [Pontibacter harenae]|nr:hypothetical protein [Pontibacter harenae]MCC9167461.1 hypothetical protein [Pontibacter harenae]